MSLIENFYLSTGTCPVRVGPYEHCELIHKLAFRKGLSGFSRLTGVHPPTTLICIMQKFSHHHAHRSHGHTGRGASCMPW